MPIYVPPRKVPKGLKLPPPPDGSTQAQVITTAWKAKRYLKKKAASVKKYRAAYKRWSDAGKPVRSRERISELFAICSGGDGGSPCPHFKNNACTACGCGVKNSVKGLTGKLFNKLRWATEGCPDNPPKFTAETSDRQDP